MKNIMQGLVLLISSFLISVAVLESLSRILLNPSDYLGVETTSDEVLGMRVPPRKGGYDEWGFRNAAVPQQVDIVTLGDSHTFGNTATMSDSWPMVLQKLSGKSVYNLGMGGYGPNQYYFLLKEKALLLRPKLVLCGLYYGDDFENAFMMTYGSEYWAFLRSGDWGPVAYNIWNSEGSQGVGVAKRIRRWLASHSVVYQMTVHGPILGGLKGLLQVNMARTADGKTSYYVDEERNIREAFLPTSIVSRLDQESKPVREGMRITFQLLERMNRLCQENGAQFIVVVIPTKEQVFSDFIEDNRSIYLSDVIRKVIVNEREARGKMIDFFKAAGIRYIDTLPDLRREVGNSLYARSDKDMHPGRNGYRVIAEAVHRHLTQSILPY